MIRHLMLAVFVAGALTARAETWKGSCDVAFTVTETFNRTFKGRGASEAFPVEIAADGDQLAATWKISVQPAKLTTDKKGRDEEMWRMFRLPEFPSAEGEAKAFNLKDAAAGKATTLPFKLTIIGVSKELQGTVSNVKLEDGKASFDVQFSVDMDSFTLKPKVLLGMFKVQNEVPVTATFHFAR